jgi:hypothetical protein
MTGMHSSIKYSNPELTDKYHSKLDALLTAAFERQWNFEDYLDWLANIQWGAT